jgi:hypothetical protein
VVQEAYVRAWQRWRRLHGYERVEGWLRLVVTRLCTDRWRHLRVRIGAGDSVADRVSAPPPADYVHETVARYRPGGAARYLAEMRDAVQRCPGGWKTVKTGVAGDESVPLSKAEPIDLPGVTGTHTQLAAIVRVGDTVIVYFAHGWEAANADRARLDRLVPAAVNRVRAWKP